MNNDTLLNYMIEQLEGVETASAIQSEDFSAIGRVQMHLDAIKDVRQQMEFAKASGDVLGYRRLGENLMVLEYSLVNEASRLAQLVKAA